MKNTKSYHPGHPNPLFYRPSWRSLNGEWAFLFDDANVGIEMKYFQSFPAKHLAINVPYAYESPASGILDKSEHNILWYRTKFMQPNTTKKAILHIERCDYQASIWLNGHFIGEHIGAYDSFAFDIDEYVKPGENELTIRVFDSKNPRQLRGKQTWKEKPFECFYHGTSGIYGNVWLEWCAPAHIVALESQASYHDGKLRQKLLFSSESIGKQLDIKVSFDNDELIYRKMTITQEEMVFAIDIPRPLQIWTTQNPNLYDSQYQIIQDGVVQDSVLSYFGINSVGVRDSKIVLNDQEVYLKFALDQGYYPRGDLTGTFDDFKLDIQYLKSAGFNGVRKHEKVEGNLFYYLADREGLLNWIELPSPHLFDIKEEQIIISQWQRIIKQHISHPSLMAYVCYNESWGVPQVMRDKQQQEHTIRLYQATKIIDGTRLVISNDGWEHTKSDILTLHNYQETKADLIKTYKDLKNRLHTAGNASANQTRMCYAQGFTYGGEPIVFSEFAGIAINENTSEAWGYGKPAIGVSGFLSKLKGQLEAICKNDVFCGYCLTQLTDVYQEKNGLMTQNREFKIKPQDLKKIL